MHICQTQTKNGQILKAIFAPEKGMNLISYSKGGVEVIDQKTHSLFEERMAGLGALIGPHFHHRPEAEIPAVKDKQLFPFMKSLIEKGQKEMFSHGIGRYVPWNFEGNDNKIEATLSGENEYKGVKLMDLEGQRFDMRYKAELIEDSLCIEYSFTKERPGVIGLHYYYALGDGEGVVQSQVGDHYHAKEGWKPLEQKWIDPQGNLAFHLNPEVDADFGFRSKGPSSCKSSIVLKTSSHVLEINYDASSEENAWQLYHPKEASYVCLEPVTAKNPRDPQLTSGHLKIEIKIF